MDIIEQLKQNERPFGLMSQEKQDKAKEIQRSKTRSCEFDCYNGVNNEWYCATAPCWDPDTVYQLRPDYVEEPEVVKCEVFSYDGHLRFDYNGRFSINNAPAWPDFIGYLYEDGVVVSYPRRYNNMPQTDIECANTREILTPTHVLFRKGKPCS